MKTKLIMVPLKHGCHVPGCDQGIHVLSKYLSHSDSVQVNVGSGNDLQVVLDACTQVERAMSASHRQNVFPLVIGGDHSLSIGSLSAVSRRKNVGVVWFDAHGDINTPESSVTKRLHGMTLAVSMQRGYKELIRHFFRESCITPAQLVYFGSRDFDLPETEFIEAENITQFTYDAIAEQGLRVSLALLSERLSVFDEIHVSFDLDVMDPSRFSSVNIPVPKGFTTAEAMQVVEHLLQNHHVCSFDVVEYNPLPDHDDRDALFVKAIIEKIQAYVAID